MHTFKRAIKAALIGAFFVGVIPAAILTAVAAIQNATGVSLIDQYFERSRFVFHALSVLCAGGVLGAMAGIASRTPKRGLTFPVALLIVFVCGAIAGFFTGPTGKLSSEEMSRHLRQFYVVTFTGALVGLAICLMLSYARERLKAFWEPTEDNDSDEVADVKQHSPRAT